MYFKIKLAVISFILSVVLFSSCTVEKRNYRKGYYINWHHGSDKNKDNIAVAKSKQNSPKTTPSDLKVDLAESSIASATGNQVLTKKEIQRKTIFEADDCGDLLTMKNGDELKAKVIEITETQIKYKRCDNLDGPLITVSKSDVFMIKYANGTKEIFKDSPAKPNNPPKQNNNSSNTTNSNRGPEVHPLAVASFVAGLTWIYFLGSVLGIVFGAIALRKIKTEPDRYKGKELAIAGIVLGALGVFLLFLVIYIIAVFG